MDWVKVFELRRPQVEAIGNRGVLGIEPRDTSQEEGEAGACVLRLLMVDDDYGTSKSRVVQSEYLNFIMSQEAGPLDWDKVRVEVYATGNFELGQKALKESQTFNYGFDGALLDLRDKDNPDNEWAGFDSIREARNLITAPPPGVLVLTRYARDEEFKERLQEYQKLDYVFASDKKPWEKHEAEQREQVVNFFEYIYRRRCYLNSPVGKAFEEFGGYATFQNVYSQLMVLEKDPKKKMPVLILGSSGTGKELVARLVHAIDQGGVGKDFQKSFKSILVSALGKGVLEGMLFGWKKGGFSGAEYDFPGLIKQYEGGSLFFDEVGDIDLGVQGALLRVLQEREIQPVGTADTVTLDKDTRFVFATNKDLRAMADEGLIREDFLHRIDGIVLWLPDLSERTEDHETLLDHLLKRHIDPVRDQVSIEEALTAEVRSRLLSLMAHGDAFRGNLRQLDRFIHRLMLLKQVDQPATMNDFEAASKRCLFPPELPVAGHELKKVFEDFGWNAFIQSSDRKLKGQMMKHAHEMGYQPSDIVSYLVEMDLGAGKEISDLTDSRGKTIPEDLLAKGKPEVIQHLRNLYSRNKVNWVTED